MGHRAVALLFIVMILAGTSGCLDWLTGSDDGKPSRTEWAYSISEITRMNDEGYDGAGVIVGIVDTGIDDGHESLKGIDIIAWRDFIHDRDDPYDDHGHGSHVAGIIAGNGHIKGASRGVSLIVAKALDDEGKGDDSTVSEAIDWVADEGAEVICLSLGGQARFLSLGDQTAASANRATNMGIFVVAAAGNDGEDDDGDVATPAGEDKVIAVGAVDSSKKLASFSSQGDNERTPLWPYDDREHPDKKPECVAPGVEIASAWNGGGYAKASGTSQATAFVSAIVALELQAHPEYKRVDQAKVTDFKNALMDSCQPVSGQNTPHDDHYGYGLIQAFQLSKEL